MAVHEYDSIPGLIRSVLADTRELMREEFELMRVEVRQEVARARAAGIAFGSAAVAALLAVTLLCVAVSLVIPYLFGWPAWTGFAIMGVLLGIVAFAAMSYGRKQLADFHALAQTRATVKENLEWIQSKSAQR
jgi:hypothetical protein